MPVSERGSPRVQVNKIGARIKITVVIPYRLHVKAGCYQNRSVEHISQLRVFLSKPPFRGRVL